MPAPPAPSAHQHQGHARRDGSGALGGLLERRRAHDGAGGPCAALGGAGGGARPEDGRGGLHRRCGGPGAFERWAGRRAGLRVPGAWPCGAGDCSDERSGTAMGAGAPHGHAGQVGPRISPGWASAPPLEPPGPLPPDCEACMHNVGPRRQRCKHQNPVPGGAAPPASGCRRLGCSAAPRPCPHAKLLAALRKFQDTLYTTDTHTHQLAPSSSFASAAVRQQRRQESALSRPCR